MWRYLVELAIVVNAIAGALGLLLRRRRQRREIDPDRDHDEYIARVLEQNRELDELIEKQRRSE
jgi:hypothetical protein